jgi:hypothetical protein
LTAIVLLHNSPTRVPVLKAMREGFSLDAACLRSFGHHFLHPAEEFPDRRGGHIRLGDGAPLGIAPQHLSIDWVNPHVTPLQTGAFGDFYAFCSRC